jgi:hypothetical protein
VGEFCVAKLLIRSEAFTVAKVDKVFWDYQLCHFWLKITDASGNIFVPIISIHLCPHPQGLASVVASYPDYWDKDGP